MTEKLSERIASAEDAVRLANELRDATLASLRALLQRAGEELGKASKALEPMSDAVYNDNHDMTVAQPYPNYDQCVAAYFAESSARALRDEIAAALGKKLAAPRRDATIASAKAETESLRDLLEKAAGGLMEVRPLIEYLQAIGPEEKRRAGIGLETIDCTTRAILDEIRKEGK